MNAPLSTHPTPPYRHTPLFPLGKDQAPYRKLSADGLGVERALGEEVLVVSRYRTSCAVILPSLSNGLTLVVGSHSAASQCFALL